MEEKKVLYSKRFPKETYAELSEETKQLNKELKMNDDIPEGEHIIDFLKRNRKAVQQGGARELLPYRGRLFPRFR